jgi:hypothetical protein
MTAQPSWRALADPAPDLAAFGAERLHDRVAYLATRKADGSPHLHPVRPVVDERFLLFELDFERAMSTTYGVTGGPIGSGDAPPDRWRIETISRGPPGLPGRATGRRRTRRRCPGGPRPRR